MSVFDELAKEYGLSDIENDFICTFLSLPSRERLQFVQSFHNFSMALSNRSVSGTLESRVLTLVSQSSAEQRKQITSFIDGIEFAKEVRN